MRAKRVHESVSFERGADPKRSMGLGRDRLWNGLKAGDVIECTRNFYLNRNHGFSEKQEPTTTRLSIYHDFGLDEPIKTGDQLIITKASWASGILEITYDYFDSPSFKHDVLSDDRWIADNVENFKRHFNVIKA